MASGRPLLASSEDQSGIKSLVHAADCGLCVMPGHAEALAEAILNLRRNPSLRETMGRRGRQYAEEHYSKQAAVARYDELLRSVGREGVRGQ